MKTFQEYYSENFAPSERDARNELDAAAAGHANRERASGAMNDEIEGMKKVELERALRELIQAATEAEHDVDSSTKQSPMKITAETKNDLLDKIADVAQRLEDDSRPIADDLVGQAGKATTGLNRSLRNSQVLDVASVDTNHLTPLIEALSALETVLEEKGLPGKLFAKEKKHDPAKAGFLTTKQHHAKKDAAAKKQKDAVQSAFTPPWMKKKKPADDSKALAKK